MYKSSLLALTSVLALTVGVQSSMQATPYNPRPVLPPVIGEGPNPGPPFELWSFDFTLANGEEAKGTFETSQTPDASTPTGNTGFTLVAINGTLNGQNITLLPVTMDTFNNNVLYPFNPNSYPNFDVNGFAFSAGSESYNIYNDNSSGIFIYQQEDLATGNLLDLQNWTSVTLVPEPLTMLGAVTALGFGITLKRKLAKKDK